MIILEIHLTRRPFSKKTGNLTHRKIQEIFLQFDINIEESLNKDDFFIISKEDNHEAINDLVARRNIISHGDTDDLIEMDTLLSYLEFIEKYFMVIIDSVSTALNNCIYSYEIDQGTFSLLEIHQVFNDNIIGFKKPTKEFANYQLLVKRTDNTYKLVDPETEPRFHDGEIVSFKIIDHAKSHNTYYYRPR